MIYDASATLRDARQIYFDANGFNNGGYDDKWVKLKAGPFAIWFPNTAARVRAVKFHDLHHVLTEYQTTWRGEAEIGAWEVASNCRGHLVAWLLNLAAFGIGLFIAPGAVFRAFIRGRHTRNLYDQPSIDPLLERRVGDVRRDLDLAGEVSPTRRDAMAFVIWSAIALATLVGPYLIGAVALYLVLTWLLR